MLPDVRSAQAPVKCRSYGSFTTCHGPDQQQQPLYFMACSWLPVVRHRVGHGFVPLFLPSCSMSSVYLNFIALVSISAVSNSFYLLLLISVPLTLFPRHISRGPPNAVSVDSNGGSVLETTRVHTGDGDISVGRTCRRVVSGAPTSKQGRQLDRLSATLRQ